MTAVLGLACLAMLATGCAQDPDVVATVEALYDGGIVVLDPPDAGKGLPPTMDTTDDMCSSGWLYGQLARVAVTCRIAREDVSGQLAAAITGLFVGAEPVADGESDAPDICDFTFFPTPYYPDPVDPATYILCPRYCTGLRRYVDETAPPAECLMP